jgi:hypothetical protein
MNRAERRKKGITSQAKTYNLNNDQVMTIAKQAISQEIHEAKLEGMRVAVDMMSAALSLALNAEFGFGVKRIEKALRHIDRNFQCINEGEITLENLQDMCREIGVEVTR